MRPIIQVSQGERLARTNSHLPGIYCSSSSVRFTPRRNPGLGTVSQRTVLVRNDPKVVARTLPSGLQATV